MIDVKGRLLLFFLLLFVTNMFLANISLAQSLYITNKKPIEVYAEQDSKSALLKTLPSGTMVTALPGNKLSGDKKFIQVKTKDDIIGWIETIYLTNEMPTQLEYLQLAAKYKAAQAKIQDYETRLLELQELRKEAKTVDWLRNKLNENNKKEAAYEQQIKLKEIASAELRFTIANLEEQLLTQNKSTGMIEPQNQSISQPAFSNYEESAPMEIYANSSSIRFYTWLVLSLAVTLIIGILLGFVLIDYKSRKKSIHNAEVY